eukprot:10996125-Lingulodinium_polyedra.AAC.1
MRKRRCQQRGRTAAEERHARNDHSAEKHQRLGRCVAWVWTMMRAGDDDGDDDAGGRCNQTRG